MQKTFKYQQVILLDNDPITNLIHTKLLNYINPALAIHIFNDPLHVIDFLKSNTQIGNTLLLLDLNMPVTSGWDFLNIFKKLDYPRKENIQITIVTSSVLQAERDQSLSFPEVSGLLIKPISTSDLKEILIG